jgi:hypothetical protein
MKRFGLICFILFCSTKSINAQINAGNFIGTYNGRFVQWFGGNLNTFSNHTVTLTPLSQNQYFEGNDQAILWQTHFVLNNDSTFCDTLGGNCICRYGYFYKLDSIYVYACALSGQWSKYYGKKMSSVGINELNESLTFNIYPNPSASKITIDVSDILFTNEKNYISLINALGQTVLKSSFNSKQTEIDVSNLPEGIYFVQVVYPNGLSVTKKIIKQ